MNALKLRLRLPHKRSKAILKPTPPISLPTGAVQTEQAVLKIPQACGKQAWARLNFLLSLLHSTEQSGEIFFSGPFTHHTGLILSIQVENGLDYWSRMTLNEALILYLVCLRII
jgi:hypothetical protein